jgi:hypothetical protein
VATDLDRTAFVWTYTKMMPLAAATIRRIAGRLAPSRSERIDGVPVRRLMAGDPAVQRSAVR